MDIKKANKCIENAKLRIREPKNHRTAYAYIAYFTKRNKLTMEEDFYIREQISKYINESNLFSLDFTINGVTC